MLIKLSNIRLQNPKEVCCNAHSCILSAILQLFYIVQKFGVQYFSTPVVRTTQMPYAFEERPSTKGFNLHVCL